MQEWPTAYDISCRRGIVIGWWFNESKHPLSLYLVAAVQVAKAARTKWRDIGGHLGCSFDELDEYEEGYKKMSDRLYHILKDWKGKQEHGARVSVLLEACRKADTAGSARKALVDPWLDCSSSRFFLTFDIFYLTMVVLPLLFLHRILVSATLALGLGLQKDITSRSLTVVCHWFVCTPLAAESVRYHAIIDSTVKRIIHITYEQLQPTGRSTNVVMRHSDWMIVEARFYAN